MNQQIGGYVFKKEVMPGKTGIQVTCTRILDKENKIESTVHLYEETKIPNRIKESLKSDIVKLLKKENYYG